MRSKDLKLGFPGSVYDPDYLFNSTVYRKGAWALHMLRHVMGDSLFFDALRSYGATFAYGNATTADFQSVCEPIYGESLAWFFNQWIYDTGRPRYACSWTQYILGGRHLVSIEVEQIQTSRPVFVMPVDIRLHSPSLDSTIVVWNRSRSERFTFEIPEPIDSVAFDPDDWILKYLEPEMSTANLGAIPSLFMANHPNPFRALTRVSAHISQAGRTEIVVFNVNGAHVKTLYKGHLREGISEFVWEGTNERGDRVSSGVYFIRMHAPQGVIVRKALLLK